MPAVCLAAPIKLFDQQRKIQGALEQAGEDLSRYAYVKYCLDKGDGEVECGDDIASILTIGYVRQKVMSVVDQRMIRQVSLGRIADSRRGYDLSARQLSFLPAGSISGDEQYPDGGGRVL